VELIDSLGVVHTGNRGIANERQRLGENFEEQRIIIDYEHRRGRLAGH
jgi:hypothetical protein